MPESDRYWWVYMVCALVMGAVGILMSATLANDVLRFNQDFGDADRGLLLLALGLGIMFLIVSLIMALMSVRARGRTRRRAAALAGQPDAIPAAQVESHPERAPDVSAAPLELLWRPARRVRYAAGPYWVLMPLFQYAAYAIALAVLFHNSLPSPPGGLSTEFSVLGIVVVLLGLGAVNCVALTLR